MGRGKSWSRDESEAVAKAWRHVSTAIASPREQGGKRFVSALYQRFVQLAPVNLSDPGRWRARSPTAVKTHFDSITDEVSKFNRILRHVINLPTTINVKPSPETLLRAAVAVHTHVIHIPQLDFNNLPPAIPEWKLFAAWRVLSASDRFAPKHFITWSAENGKPIPPELLPLNEITQRTNPEAANVASTAAPSAFTPDTNAAIHPTVPAASADNTDTDPSPRFQRFHYNTSGSNVDDAEHAFKKRRVQNGSQPGEPLLHAPNAQPDVFTTIATAIQRVADGLNAVAAAHTERNLISLLSLPHVETSEHRAPYLSLLLENHLTRLKSLTNEPLKQDVQPNTPQDSQGTQQHPNGAEANSMQPSTDSQQQQQHHEPTQPSSVTNENSAD